jgi:CheY-like chemotaxis protein
MEPMLQRLIGEDVHLSVVDCGAGPVKADPGQLEQVVLNLAVNARDAMPQGGRLTIQVAGAELDELYARGRPDVRPGPYVRVSVSDTGSGMSAEVQAHLFEPFFTTKEPGKGTGLGLSTVHGIVKASGGHLAVSSELGRGTTFRVYLPRAEEPSSPQAAPAEGDAPRGTETVLVVEDEGMLRGLLTECLGALGYTVLSAPHPAAAIAESDAHAGRIDLSITDVVMPGMGGRELAQRLAPAHPEMRVLYVSGYTDDAVVLHDVLLQRVAFLQKPFTASVLARKVRQVLEGKISGAQRAV